MDFVPRNGAEAGERTILESLGTGVALVDYDRDGHSDVFFPGGGTIVSGPSVRGRPPAFYRNHGRWRFDEVAQSAGVHTDRLYSHGAYAGDFDGDGFPDLLVTGYHGLLLYHNRGDGTFAECSRAAGLDPGFWNTGAAWGDVNGDGILDLYVVQYVDWSFENHPYCPAAVGGGRDVCPPGEFAGLPDRLFLGNGDGTFREVSQERGLRRDGKGLAVLMGDVDVDGDTDIYVANDTTRNFLYRNEGDGQFHEVGIPSGTALSASAEADGSMGVDLGDFNGDGLPDLWVANFEDQSFALYRNEGNCMFQHVSDATGLAALGQVYVGWGTAFFDADCDGDRDVFAVNGHVMHGSRNAPFRQRPLLLENRPGRRFVNAASQAGEYFQAAHMARGAAVGDLDNDGDLDLAIAHTNERVALLSNETPTPGHWIKLRLIGTRSHRDAVGARIRLIDGGTERTRQRKGGTSYLSSHAATVFCGLGSKATVDRVEIRWPSGTVQQLKNVRSGQTRVVREPR